MDLGVTLMIAGVIIGFLAFAFAAVNMLRGFNSQGSMSFGGLFAGHIGAMIGMALGSAIFSIGLIMTVANFLTHAVR
jgi:hypothetical protein